MAFSLQDCYKVLQVAPGASPAELKAAYRKLAKVYHPDLGGRTSNSLRFAEIVEAYRLLSCKPSAASEEALRGSAHFTSARRPRQAYRFRERTPLGVLGREGRQLLAAADPALRRKAAINLGLSGIKSAYGFLRHALYDDDLQVQLAVVKAISALQVPQAPWELAALFLKARREVKLAILEGAGALQVQPGYAALLRLGLRDDDPLVRQAAFSRGTRPH